MPQPVTAALDIPHSADAAPAENILREMGSVRSGVLLLLLVAHIAFAAFAVVPGHLVSDEGLYHQMSRALADGHPFTVWTGYEEYPSREFYHWLHKISPDGQVLSQYPYLYPYLAWPFYQVAGFRGLFILNALAFVGVCGLTFATARRFYRDPRIAADAVIVMTVATYAWQYGHAAWSQMFAAAFVMGALYLAIRGLQSDRLRPACLFAAGSGLAVGFGSGIRLDVLFVTLALVAPFVFAWRPRWREALCIVAGLAPGIALLSLTNHVKFGTFNPFSYGVSSGGMAVSGYVPLLTLGAVVLATGWAVTRRGIWIWLAGRRLPALAGGTAAALLAALVVPQIGSLAVSMLDGLWQLIVDFRLRDASLGGPALTRGPAGSIMYNGVVKKSLLQSLPWLPVLALPVIEAWREPERRPLLAVVTLAVAGFVGVYSYRAWHGGYAFNLRYFVPLLPLFAVYGARGAHILADAVGVSRAKHIATAVLATSLWLFLLYRDPEIEATEAVTLNLPLALAFLLTIVLAFRAFSVRRLSGIARTVLMVCFAWSAVIALANDFLKTYVVRLYHAETSAVLLQNMPPDSIVFAMYHQSFFALTDVPKARAAFVDRDDFRDFRPLLDFHMAAGRPAFAFFTDENWDLVREGGRLDGVSASFIAEVTHGKLYRLSPAGGDRDGS